MEGYYDNYIYHHHDIYYLFVNEVGYIIYFRRATDAQNDVYLIYDPREVLELERNYDATTFLSLKIYIRSFIGGNGSA